MSIDFAAVEIGRSYRVAGFRDGDVAYRNQLLAFGLTKGADFRVVRRAPLGDPIQIEIRGTALTLRACEAVMLEIIAL